MFQRVITEPFERYYEKLLEFLPGFLTSIFILIWGVVLAVVLRIAFLKFLRAVKFDKFSERFGIIGQLGKSGIKETASVLLSRMIGWVIIFIFTVVSLYALNIRVVDGLLDRFLFYLPNIFAAALILFFGYIISNFMGRAALIAAVNAGIKISNLIGKLVKLTIFIIAVTMALEQLGIGKETVVIAFTIIFGGIILALAIAFGLGGRDIVKDYVEKKAKGEEKKDDINHL